MIWTSRKGSRIAFLMSAIYGVIILRSGSIGASIDHSAVCNRGQLGGIWVCPHLHHHLRGILYSLGMIFIYRNVMQSCGFALMPMMGGVVELVSRAVLAIVAQSSATRESAANPSAWCLGGIFLHIAYRFTMKKWNGISCLPKRKRSLFLLYKEAMHRQ